jgi:acid phosphatase type 7
MKSLVIISLIASICYAQVQQQVHVAQGTNAGTIIFSWSTRDSTPTTYVRIASGSQWALFSGEAAVFTDSTNIWYFHSVSVNLIPGNNYNYQVGCQVTGYSSTYNLLVPVDSDSANFIIYGDLATGQYGENTWADIVSVAKDLLTQTIIQVGDMAYNLDTNNSVNGDNFMTALEPLASYMPYMVCAGNHETSDNYYNYLQRFMMPGTKFYHTFTTGYVRFVAVHTEAFLTETYMLNSMLAFVKQTLNRSPDDKAKYPWVVVFGHRPMYCTCKASKETCTTEADTIKKSLEGLLYQYNVDLYVNGHIHNYQRTCPVYLGSAVGNCDPSNNVYINPRAPIYVTTGGPGADGTDTTFSFTNAPSYIMAGDDSYTFTLMNVFNSSHLYWEQYGSKKNTIKDSFWIIKY